MLACWPVLHWLLDLPSTVLWVCCLQLDLPSVCNIMCSPWGRSACVAHSRQEARRQTLWEATPGAEVLLCWCVCWQHQLQRRHCGRPQGDACAGALLCWCLWCMCWSAALLVPLVHMLGREEAHTTGTEMLLSAGACCRR